MALAATAVPVAEAVAERQIITGGNDVYTVLISTWSHEESNIPGNGGKGSAGTAGYKGCLIIYY